MSLIESVSFPIKAQSIPMADEEEALCSSQGEDETSTETNRNEEATSLLQSLETPKEKDDKLEMNSTALLKKLVGEMEQMRRKRDELEQKLQRQNEDLERKLQRQQDDLEQMKQLVRANGIDIQQGASQADSGPSGGRTNLLQRSSSTIIRSTLNIGADGEQHYSLPQDTFSIMMVSNLYSGSWLLGFLVYVIQMTLFVLLCIEMFTREEGGILAQFAEKPVAMVSWAQLLVLFAIFFLQSDLVEATRCIFMLKEQHMCHLTSGGAGEGHITNNTIINCLSAWWNKICFIFPNVLKLSMAIITIMTSVFVTLQTEKVLELLKDFSALMIVNEIDNRVFTLFVENGLCGLEAKKRADEVTTRSVKVTVVPSMITQGHDGRTGCCSNIHCFKARWLLILAICNTMTILVTWSLDKEIISSIVLVSVMAWVTVIGVFILYKLQQRISQGGFRKDALFIFTIYILALAAWITIFSLQQNQTVFLAINYPDCKVQNPNEIRDGHCDGGEHNTAECGFDGGDCDEFNEKYPNCNADTPFFIGDGRCHGGDYDTEECGWDGGDCAHFNEKYPNCEVSLPYLVGNGYCNSYAAYNTAECGWDGGDCN